MPPHPPTLVDLPVDILRKISTFVGDMSHTKSANLHELALEFPIATLSRDLFNIFRSQVTEIDLAYPELPDPHSFWSYTLTCSSSTPYVTSLIRGAMRNCNNGLNLFRIPYEYCANQCTYLSMIGAIALHADTLTDLSLCALPATLCYFSSFRRLRSLTLRDVSSNDLDDFDTSIFRLHTLQILDSRRLLGGPRALSILNFMDPLIASLENVRIQLVTTTHRAIPQRSERIIRQGLLNDLIEKLSDRFSARGQQLKQFHVVEYLHELPDPAHDIKVPNSMGFITGIALEHGRLLRPNDRLPHLLTFTVRMLNRGWMQNTITSLGAFAFTLEAGVELSPLLATVCCNPGECDYQITGVFLDPNFLYFLRHRIGKSIRHVRMVQLPHPKHLRYGTPPVSEGVHPPHFYSHFLTTIWEGGCETVNEVRAAYSCASLTHTRNLKRMLQLICRSIPNVKVLHLSRSFLSKEQNLFQLHTCFPRLETLLVHNCSYLETIDNDWSLANVHLPFFNAIHRFVSMMAEMAKLADYDEVVANSDESSFRTVISQPTLRYIARGRSSPSYRQPDSLFRLRYRFAEIREKFLLFQTENHTIDVKTILRDLDGLLSEKFLGRN